MQCSSNCSLWIPKMLQGIQMFHWIKYLRLCSNIFNLKYRYLKNIPIISMWDPSQLLLQDGDGNLRAVVAVWFYAAELFITSLIIALKIVIVCEGIGLYENIVSCAQLLMSCICFWDHKLGTVNSCYFVTEHLLKLSLCVFNASYFNVRLVCDVASATSHGL